MAGVDKKPNPWIPIVISILSLVAGGGWIKYYLEAESSAQEKNQQLVVDYLAPIEALLSDNLAIKNRIYEKYREGGWGILESYVVRMQRGTSPEENRLMTADIVVLVENNKRIMTLLTKYAGYTLTDDFKTESTKFRAHAQEWVNRWSAVQSYIDNDAQLAWAAPFPEGFPGALEAELAKRGAL
ncbi:hypothetical protein [Motiliproteus sp. SC1-56]|uniref:hypothetical protein n=1 Tax=Motiliproteus sp. SC1-56 TaxID=2799565 RepID=UPI001A8F8C7F|nr:hypothetical protein [Motiliproteus sp. SC1-56]